MACNKHNILVQFCLVYFMELADVIMEAGKSKSAEWACRLPVLQF